jgi:response regulator RpfG family c-di-GMP phosphodiesterase
VDDEPQILKALSIWLGNEYDLDTATGGAAALELLAREPGIAVIISDMRMPGMDGAAFLAHARQIVPDAVRMLFTGYADIDSAIAAINEGQIFRFLMKPCLPETILTAVSAAVEQHRLITAERVLLEQTLHGSIKTLTDILALVNPTSFGRADRIKQLVSELAEKLGIRERWQVEVAAMLSQLGYITLPPETVERVYYGQPLSVDEQKLVGRLPELTEELLGNIPRLEAVREILKNYPKPYTPEIIQTDPHKRLVAQGAHLLRVAVDFDALGAPEKVSAGMALTTLRNRADQYDPEVLEALAAIRCTEESLAMYDMPLSDLRVGMILAEDVKMQNGVLLVARGYEITERFLERIRNFAPSLIQKKTWRVLVRTGGTG